MDNLTKACIDRDGVLTLNEFDLHDWVVGLAHTNNIDGNPENEEFAGTFFCQFSLVLDGEEPFRMSEEDRKLLEDCANRLLEHISNFDTLLHDLAEYSC